MDVAMQIGGSLAALLQKLGLGAAPEGTPDAQGGEGEAKGLAAQIAKAGAEGAEKGLELGPDGEVLSGLGYSGADKETGKKNVNEKANIEQFLQQDSTVERRAEDNPFTQLSERQSEEAAPKEKLAEQTEAAERREAADGEVRREEKADEARVQGQQEGETQEAKEQSEVEEAPGRQQHEDEDEEDKPGAGWVAEELEEEEAHERRKLRDADALGEVHRCRGILEDGTGCLRKPVSGTPYCPEHALVVRRPIEKA